MNKRQRKKHFKKAFKLAVFSFELADRYLARYHLIILNKNRDEVFDL